MRALFNDLFHAQPDALFMVVGLAFLAVSIIGSVKTYFDPGKYGRIAAGVLGLGLLLFGFHLYTPTPVDPPVPEPVNGPLNGSANGSAAGREGTAHPNANRPVPPRKK